MCGINKKGISKRNGIYFTSALLIIKDQNNEKWALCESDNELDFVMQARFFYKRKMVDFCTNINCLNVSMATKIYLELVVVAILTTMQY